MIGPFEPIDQFDPSREPSDLFLDPLYPFYEVQAPFEEFFPGNPLAGLLPKAVPTTSEVIGMVHGHLALEPFDPAPELLGPDFTFSVDQLTGMAEERFDPDPCLADELEAEIEGSFPDEGALSRTLSGVERDIVGDGRMWSPFVGNGPGERLGPASAYEDDLSKMLTRVEASIEGTEIRPLKFPETPSPESFRPGGFRHADPNFLQEEGRSFYPGLSNHVSYRIRSGRTGARAPEEDIYCWPQGEYVKKKDVCEELACRFFDNQLQTCTWLDENETQASE